MKRHRTLAAALIVALVIPAFVLAQTPPAPRAPAPTAPAAAAPGAPAASGKTFRQEELDQLLAPIALYPDALLAQVLMASTYPLEIVEASRWVKANPSLKDKALQDALQQQKWDASVKSLAAFPQVITMMSEKLDWTQKLGDAFLAQQQDVMATVQGLRQKANAQGNLKTTKEQKVIVEQDPAATTAVQQTIIKIEPATPEVVYVPTYNPTVVYGAWAYPTYPPYYYYPPGYVAGAAAVGFTAGVIAGAALWGGCNWRGGDVNVNVNRYNNFNRTNIQNTNWQHNSTHRGAVPYRDKSVAQQYNRGGARDAQSREQFRGRAEAGQQSIQRGEVSRNFDGNRAGASSQSQNRSASAGGGNRDFGSRDSSGTRNASAFDTGGRTTQTRDASSRGASSLSSSRSSGNMSSSRGGGSGGGARAGGGGGGARGGGGGRGGGRR
jgi:hypothetical protein